MWSLVCDTLIFPVYKKIKLQGLEHVVTLFRAEEKTLWGSAK